MMQYQQEFLMILCYSIVMIPHLQFFQIEKLRINNYIIQKDNIRSGVIYGKDYIGMTNDSSIGYDLDVLKPGESKKICIYVYAKR